MDSLTITGNTWIWLGQFFVVNYNDPFLAHTDQDDSPLILPIEVIWGKRKKKEKRQQNIGATGLAAVTNAV